MQTRSMSAVKLELDQLRKDRTAFARAYDILCRRMIESNEIPERRPLLHEWSGSRSCVGSLEMAIYSIELAIEEHLNMIEAIERGEIQNLDDKGMN